jgi:uncharacterized protein YndB with AHSA1/START domain
MTTLQEIRKTVTLNASIEKVWKAVATSEGISKWWMQNTFEPIQGKDFILHTGHFGDTPCKITNINEPNSLSFDWGSDWHITFELKSLEEGKTQFTLIHSGWDAAKITEIGQPHTVVRNIMDNGWECIVKENLPKSIEE